MKDLVVLCYHAVSPTWTASLSVTPAELRWQLEHFVERGYRGATFSDAMSAPVHPKTLVVSFDDAFASVAELAAPVLAELGLPGTLYAVTNFGDGERPLSWAGIDEWEGGPHAEELRCLDWTRMRALADTGWEIGSHTVTHPRLTQVGEAALERELRDSRAICEEALGLECRSIAYPYGDVDRRVIATAAAAGYRCAAGLPSDSQPIMVTPMAWPRVGIYHGQSRRKFRIKTSPAVRVLRQQLSRARERVRR